MAKVKGKTAPLDASPTHLLHRVLQRALDFHTEASGPSGLTQRQYAVLAAAGAADGLSQSDLVRATGIDRSTLADLVARMIAKGLIERERSAADARANTVRLSPAGRASLEAGVVPAAAADRKLLGLLSPKKRDGFLKALTILAEPPKARKAARKAQKADKPAKAGKKKSKKAQRAAA